MKTLWTKLLTFLGLRKKVITGQRARIFVNGEEVRFDLGDRIEFNIEPIEVLGRFEPVDISQASLKLIKGPGHEKL